MTPACPTRRPSELGRRSHKAPRRKSSRLPPLLQGRDWLRPRAANPRKRRTPRPCVVDRMQRDLAGLAAGAGVGDGFADAEVFAHGAVAVARSEVDRKSTRLNSSH